MNSHISQAEQARVKDLEGRRQAAVATSREIVELALIYWEPLHREADAVSILRDLLVREPGNNLAKLWLGYIYTYYYFMLRDASLERASVVLNEVIASGEPTLVAGARVVLYGSMKNLDAGERLLSSRIACLEESVKTEPAWVFNREYLAVEYLEAQRYTDALHQIRFAQRNVLSKPLPADRVDRQFEISITGRLSERGQQALKSLEAKLLTERPELGLADR